MSQREALQDTPAHPASLHLPLLLPHGDSLFAVLCGTGAGRAMQSLEPAKNRSTSGLHTQGRAPEILSVAY